MCNLCLLQCRRFLFAITWCEHRCCVQFRDICKVCRTNAVSLLFMALKQGTEWLNSTPAWNTCVFHCYWWPFACPPGPCHDHHDLSYLFWYKLSTLLMSFFKASNLERYEEGEEEERERERREETEWVSERKRKNERDKTKVQIRLINVNMKVEVVDKLYRKFKISLVSTIFVYYLQCFLSMLPGPSDYQWIHSPQGGSFWWVSKREKW